MSVLRVGFEHNTPLSEQSEKSAQHRPGGDFGHVGHGFSNWKA
jgi:hypothetical protein